GNHGAYRVEELQIEKFFELELSNMEDSPVYALSNQLTVGSEIGNIVISDTSVSPRHATFLLQDEVVSVIDHGSVTGTKVNGQEISAGRYIILQESDIITVGDLEIRIKTHSKIVPPGEIPDLPIEEDDIPAIP